MADKEHTRHNQDKKAAGIAITLAGGAGQGIQSIEALLVNTFKRDGFHVFATKEYMSRVRGGTNSTQIRVSETAVSSYLDRMDIFVPLDKAAYERYKHKIGTETLVIGDKDKIGYDEIVNIPFAAIASELGSPIYANTVAAGTICALLGVSKQILKDYLNTIFEDKKPEVIKANGDAADKGYSRGEALKKGEDKDTANKNGISNEKLSRLNLPRQDSKGKRLLLSGSDAVAIGALAGGCNACFAYPMTPGTSVFTAMASYSQDAGIAVEQVEDEIGVINMALGAWYAGGRALISTSGGGFALMGEGVSLAGMIETPMVLHLAQRPGPATGLPTRTEQGDLNLVLHAGHGVFPRIILAPGTTQQAFELSARAFDLADRFQVPVFILTDQYFVDTYYDTEHFKLNGQEPTVHIVETKEGYKRYTLSDSGISPRGIPDYGSGLVGVDSDEHDEGGRITEDLDGISLQMKDKRFRKFKTVQEAALQAELTGPRSYKRLIVGWGSVYTAIQEALSILDDPETAFLFFPQLYPLPESAKTHLQQAEQIIAIENNQTGQFADLLQAEFGIPVHRKILKYNGLAFSVEEVIAALQVESDGQDSKGGTR